MPLHVQPTPRDRLDRLVDYAVKVRRYWWLVAAFVVIGGGLSVAFAMTRPQTYQSSAVLSMWLSQHAASGVGASPKRRLSPCASALRRMSVTS